MPAGIPKGSPDHAPLQDAFGVVRRRPHPFAGRKQRRNRFLRLGASLHQARAWSAILLPMVVRTPYRAIEADVQLARAKTPKVETAKRRPNRALAVSVLRPPKKPVKWANRTATRPNASAPSPRHGSVSVCPAKAAAEQNTGETERQSANCQEGAERNVLVA